MSKLIREVTAVFDEAFSVAQDFTPLMARWLAEDLSPEDMEAKVKNFMSENKPKTYDNYVDDLIHIFETNGWKKEPTTWAN